MRYFDTERVVSNNQLMRGTAVSSGIAHGTAYVLHRAAGAVVPRRALEAAEVAGELSRFEDALGKAEQELLALRKDVAERIGPGPAGIFAAQAVVVRDPALHDKVVVVVREKGINVEAALVEVIDQFTRTFDQIHDACLRERAADIRDVGRRVLGALIAHDGPATLDIPEGSILVADELLPSAIADLELNRVKAFVTERGGKFSHTSILARSMRMPAITGVPEAARKIETGDELVVDGVSGIVIVDPDVSLQRDYDRLEAELRGYKAELQKLVDQPSITLDGTAIPLLANVSKFSDTEAAILYKADGTLAAAPEILAVVRHILGAEPRFHVGDVCRLVSPGAFDLTTPPHQDAAYVAEPTEVWTAWIPIGPCPLALGPLALLAGSHTGGLRQHAPVTPGSGGIAVPDDAPWRSLDLEAGDVIVFSALTVHRALPNVTADQLRVSVDYRYRPAR